MCNDRRSKENRFSGAIFSPACVGSRVNETDSKLAIATIVGEVCNECRVMASIKERLMFLRSESIWSSLHFF